ncbi:MAG: bifunctional diaminohydroxyphosphoribosylaminopyrimidine deaminase/5-amino-6-(5-phosphoribosylamino)uracil reductase RibD [bacterium]
MQSADERYMLRALQLAKRGYGLTSPNPMVGAVLVRNHSIVGQGYHHYAGSDHAEIIAMNQAGNKAKGATLYITLEPCCHYGKTPPCTDRIIRAGITRVVAASIDPNPIIFGKGISRLKQAGIKVEVGLKESESKKLNEPFFKYIRTDLPFGILKLGMSLDGKIATSTGESRWITSTQSREYVHHLRAGVDAILVGENTVIQDDPELTVRIPKYQGKQPTRIIVCNRGEIPLSARIFKTSIAKTILVMPNRIPQYRQKKYRNAGIPLLIIPGKNNRVDIKKLFFTLGQEQLLSVLIEGGSGIAWSCLSAGVIDKLIFFLAPKLIGGKEAPSTIGGVGIKKLNQAVQLNEVQVERIGEDIKIEAYLKARPKF